jgi:hypothetical protein
MESAIKQEYETVVTGVIPQLKQSGRLSNLPKHDLDDMLDGFKVMFYNKANMYAVCLGEAIRSKRPGIFHLE